MAGDEQPVERRVGVSSETVFGVDAAQHRIRVATASLEAALDVLIDDLSSALHEREGTGGVTVSQWIKNHGAALVALATALGAAATNLGFFGGDSEAMHVLTIAAVSSAFAERVLQAFRAGATPSASK